MADDLDTRLKTVFKKNTTIFTEDYEKLKSFNIPLPFLPIYYHNISRQLNVQSCGINPTKAELSDIFSAEKIEELKKYRSDDPELKNYWKYIDSAGPGESLMDVFIKSPKTYPVAFDLICRIQLLSEDEPSRTLLQAWLKSKEEQEHPFIEWFENQENSICYHPAAMNLIEKYLYTTFDKFKPYVESVKKAFKGSRKEEPIPNLSFEERKDFQENILTLFEVYFQNNEKLIVFDPKKIEKFKSEKSNGSYTFNLEDPANKQMVLYEILIDTTEKKQKPVGIIRNGSELLPWQDEAHPEFAKIFDESFLNEIFR